MAFLLLWCGQRTLLHLLLMVIPILDILLDVAIYHLILPVFISIAVIVPFRTPFATETNTGTVFPSVPLTKKSHTAWCYIYSTIICCRESVKCCMNIPGLSPTTPVDIDSNEEISKKIKGEPLAVQTLHRQLFIQRSAKICPWKREATRTETNLPTSTCWLPARLCSP